MPSRFANAVTRSSSAWSKVSPYPPPDRRLDRDHRHRAGHAAARRPRDDLLHLVEAEPRAPRRERHQGDAAQRLHAVAGVVEEVALGLHDGAAGAAGERAHRQVVGERPGRQEDGALLAEHPGEVLLERRDGAAVGVAVALDPPVAGQLRPERRRLRRSQPEAVAGHPDGPGFGDAARRGARRPLGFRLHRRVEAHRQCGDRRSEDRPGPERAEREEAPSIETGGSHRESPPGVAPGVSSMCGPRPATPGCAASRSRAPRCAGRARRPAGPGSSARRRPSARCR